MEFRYFLDESRLITYSTISNDEFVKLVSSIKTNKNYPSELFSQIDLLVQDLILDITPNNKGFINYLRRSLEIDSLRQDLLKLLSVGPHIDLKFWEYLLFTIVNVEITEKCIFMDVGLMSLYMFIISNEKETCGKKCKITDKILKNKTLKPLWIKDFVKTIDFYKLNMTFIDEFNYNEISIMLEILFHYWNNGLYKLNISDITINYLDNYPISIYQYQKSNQIHSSDEIYPLMVHLFYIIYAIIEIIYISLINKLNSLDDHIKELENTYQNIGLNVVNAVNIELNLNNLKETRKKLLCILRNSSGNIDNFMMTLFRWSINILDINSSNSSNSSNKINASSLFNQVIQTYIKFYENSEILKLGAQMPYSSLSTLIELFNDLSLSKPIRFEIFNLMETNLYNRNLAFIEDYYFYNSSLPAIINLYIESDYDYRCKINRFLRGCFVISKNVHNSWLKLLNSSNELDINILKFLNIIFSDLSTFLGKSLDEIELIHLYEMNPEDPLLKEKHFDLNKSKNSTSIFIRYVKFSFDFIDKMESAPIKYYLCSELNNQIAKTFDFYLTKLLGSKNIKLKINCADDIYFYPLDLLVSIGNVMCNILGYDVPNIFIENLCNDLNNFDINIYKKFKNTLKKKGVLDSKLEITLNNLLNKLEKYIELYGKIELPDDFCDPFFCNPIINPVCVPSSGIIMDSNNLRRMVLENNRDPYQQELSIEQLELFNKKDEIKCKLDDFIKRKNEWIRANITK